MIGNTHAGITEEILNTLGNKWEKKTNEIRWYVNDWMDAIELEVGYYKTGNVSDVAWHGDGRSNCWYKKYVMGTKVWIDIDGAVHVDYCKETAVERAIIEAIGKRIEAAISVEEEIVLQVVLVDDGAERVLMETRQYEDIESATSHGIDWLELHGVRAGVDESEQDLRVRINGMDVWSWLDAIVEA